MKFPIGAMTVGDVLDRGLKLLLGRLPMYYAINLITTSPVIVLSLLLPLAAQPSLNPDPQTLMILAGGGLFILVLTIIGAQIGAAAILRVVLNDFTGRPVSFGDAFSFAMGKFGALLSTSILAGIIIMLGLFCCIIPGIYFAISYAFYSQIVVMENSSGMDALKRSSNLISGHRGRVFGTLFLIGIATSLVSAGVAAILNQAFPAVEEVQTARGLEDQVNMMNNTIDTIVNQLVNILFTTYASVCTTLLYLDMRIRKEGLDLELQAQRAAEM